MGMGIHKYTYVAPEDKGITKYRLAYTENVWVNCSCDSRNCKTEHNRTEQSKTKREKTKGNK